MKKGRTAVDDREDNVRIQEFLDIADIRPLIREHIRKIFRHFRCSLYGFIEQYLFHLSLYKKGNSRRTDEQHHEKKHQCNRNEFSF